VKTAIEITGTDIRVGWFKHCARCDGEHGPMLFKLLGVPMSRKGVVTHTHWASCPTTGEPILMIQEADDVPARRDVVVRPAPPARADGGVCRDCGGMTVPTGACSTCRECGSTGGCG
jgi:hypothetical protein